MSWQLSVLLATLAGAGAASGFLAGLFGVGGGAIVVAALYQAFSYAGLADSLCMRMSVGTAFAVMVPTSAISFRGHSRRGSADQRIARLWVVPVVCGVAAGSLLAAHLDGEKLKAIFIALVLFNAAKLLSGWPVWRMATDVPSAAAVRASGVVIGFLSSLIGIGGGIFGNMFLTAYGRPMHQAIGTTASLGAIISLAGTCTFMLLGLGAAGLPPGSIGFVSVIAGCIVAPIASALAPLGVRVAHRFTREQLRIGFGLFLIVVSGRFLASLFLHV
ncbi:MAG: sulfite exporter TauE/SafE family protein [Pseudomonadota bacterium]|nr:sulfite exporter TauE/SafE family protein [Pseudomonadota bacterium]